MSENKTYNVKNRSAGSVVYTIPEIGVRREFAPGESKKLSFVELEKLTFVPGGRYLMANYLQIDEEKINEEFNIKTEPEYYMSEADVIALLKTGELDALLDALDFAPAGIIDLIKEKTLEIDKKSIVRIVLTGKVEDEFAKDLVFITSHFEDKFFAFSIKDDSKLFIDFKTYQNNVSLKGEFVKLALSEKMDEKVSQKVITAVLNALNSEELGI